MTQENSNFSILTIFRHVINAFAVCMMTYLVINTKSYEVTWTWEYLFPISVIQKINASLTSLGTMVLVGPLAIVLASYLLPDNKQLRTASTLFTGGFGLYVIFQHIRTGGNLDNIRNIFFTIHDTTVLEAKLNIFIAEWSKLLESNTIKTRERYAFLENYLETHINTDLKNVISNTHKKFITALAHEIFETANLLYQDSLKPSMFSRVISWVFDHKKTVTGIVLFSCGSILIWYFNNDAISTVIDAGKHFVSTFRKTAEHVAADQISSNDANTRAIAELAVTVDVLKNGVDTVFSATNVAIKSIFDFFQYKGIIASNEDLGILTKFVQKYDNAII